MWDLYLGITQVSCPVVYLDCIHIRFFLHTQRVDDGRSWRKSNDPLFPAWLVVVSQMWENMSLRDGHDLSEVFKDPRAPRHCKNKIMVCFDLYSTQCNNSSQG